MKQSGFVLLFVLACIAGIASTESPSSQTSPFSNPKTEQELKAIAQELLDALATGDKSPWTRHLAESCLIRDENGGVITKAELIAELKPLPEGYKGSIEVTEPQVRDYGDVAIITHLDVEHLEIFGQKLTTHFTCTDTYLRRNGKWQMIASQITALPSELTPVPVDPEKLKSITGIYELTPEVVYTITLEGNKLTGQRTGREKEELLPESETRFFRKGNPRGLKIFIKNEQGQVVKMLDRRENNDLVWRKIK